MLTSYSEGEGHPDTRSGSSRNMSGRCSRRPEREYWDDSDYDRPTGVRRQGSRSTDPAQNEVVRVARYRCLCRGRITLEVPE